MQINEFQEMMRRLYFKRDLERGVDGTFNWLVDEVKELGDELKKSPMDKEATEKEFADVIAWLAVLRSLSAQPRGCPVRGVADPGPGQGQEDSHFATGSRIRGTARSLPESGTAAPLWPSVVRLPQRTRPR